MNLSSLLLFVAMVDCQCWKRQSAGMQCAGGLLIWLYYLPVSANETTWSKRKRHRVSNGTFDSLFALW